MFKVNNKDTRIQDTGIFIVNFKHISHLVLGFLLFTFEQINAGWVVTEDRMRKLRQVNAKVCVPRWVSFDISVCFSNDFNKPKKFSNLNRTN